MSPCSLLKPLWPDKSARKKHSYEVSGHSLWSFLKKPQIVGDFCRTLWCPNLEGFSQNHLHCFSIFSYGCWPPTPQQARVSVCPSWCRGRWWGRHVGSPWPLVGTTMSLPEPPQQSVLLRGTTSAKETCLPQATSFQRQTIPRTDQHGVENPSLCPLHAMLHLKVCFPRNPTCDHEFG